MKTLNRKVLRDFTILKSQAATTALLIASGIAVLISAWSAYDSLKHARDLFYGEFRFADVFAELKTAPRTIINRIQSIHGVDILEPRIVTQALLRLPGRSEPVMGRFVSIPDDRPPLLNQIHLRSGRWPSVVPRAGIDAEVVAGEAFAEANALVLDEEITAVFKGRLRKLLVVGIGVSPEYVYTLNPQAPVPDDRHFGVFWLCDANLSTFENMAGSFNSISLRLAPNTSDERVRTQLDALLKPYGALGSYSADKQLSNMFVSDEIAEQRASATVLPAIFLSVAAFLLHVVFGRLIGLQRVQIATLKANGYRNAEVSLHYLKLAVLMVSVGILPGIILGLVFGRWQASLYKSFFRFHTFPFMVSSSSILVGVFAGFFFGLLGTAQAVRSAFRMRPAEAMRPLAPPVFRSNWFERSRLFQRLNIPVRMVARNLLSRPLRLVLSIAGLGAAAAIIIMAMFWKDSIRYVIDRQFYFVDRGDIQVSFYEPRTVAVLRELKQIPGVTNVEGYRGIPVRLLHEQREKEVLLAGYPKDARFRRILDIKLKEVRLPESGVLLNAALREKWNLRAGDVVRAQHLEGRQEVWELRVSGFVDDMIGDTVYIKNENLWHLLDETATYSSASLQVSPQHIQDVYFELQRRPVVQSVLVKTAMIESLKGTIERMILAFVFILSGFATLIAIGVVYNTARVNLSERAWELASLRILGFGRAFAFWLFFGELALQVALSLPVGIAMGYGLSYLSILTIHTETFRFPLIISTSSYATAVLVVLAAFALSVAVINIRLKAISLSEALKARE